MENIPLKRPQLPFMTALGLLYLTISASSYAIFGLSAYPAQEWLLELLVAIVFLIPAVNLLVTEGKWDSGVRFVAGALLVHSLYGLLHWPSRPWIDTPVPHYIPKLFPVGDIFFGFWLLARGR